MYLESKKPFNFTLISKLFKYIYFLKNNKFINIYLIKSNKLYDV